MQTENGRSLATDLRGDEQVASRRWRTSLHEAGHGVAGRVLLNCAVKAVVYEADVGAAYLELEAAVPRTFQEVLMIAVGPAAETLVDGHAPPLESPPPPLTEAYPEEAAPLVSQLRQSPSDAVRIAQWCVRGIECQPERWAKRFYWIHREADLFVARHQREIVEVAAGLYQRGIVTLEAEVAACPASGEVPPPRR